MLLIVTCTHPEAESHRELAQHGVLRCGSVTLHQCSSTKAEKQGVTRRCRLSWLTNSALVCMPKFGGWGGGGGLRGLGLSQ
jgi:hypothetical protein